jgi:hypothetical protein
MKRCPRCGSSFQVIRLDQRYCGQCERETALILAADARRNVVRFPRAADFTGRIAA